ncbi:hypothetical protein [Laspinema olomoucense]|uniref:Uncharacterized protein n=1 Tax=Laspinema olomoucense D3b TaxID=2953688 RepID=A0ABT2NFV5_9CYAN|nr:hypothetical protein [Laspinema sp. D3b]MCT7981574.1 hypothetical protein [Laspinema sp. D3b]
MKKSMDSTYFFADQPFLLTRLDNLFHAISTIPSGKINRLHSERDRAIAAIQLDLLWSVALESEEPASLMALAPWRLIYGNKATGGADWQGRSLTESWPDEKLDSYLVALIRDGVHEGSGVRSELFTLADGRKIVLQLGQA